MEEKRLTVRSKRSPKEYFSDKVAHVLGSWTFVLFQLTLCFLWIIINTIPMFTHYDPFPFSILANLFQIEGALAASFILISSNRQNEIKSNKDLQMTKHIGEDLDEVRKRLSIDIKV